MSEAWCCCKATGGGGELELELLLLLLWGGLPRRPAGHSACDLSVGPSVQDHFGGAFGRPLGSWGGIGEIS